MRANQRCGEALPSDSRRGQLWFGLLGGACAWMAHLVLAYVIAEFGCVSSVGTRMLGGLSLVAWQLLGVTLVLEFVAILSLLAAWRCRTTSDSTPANALRETALTGLIAGVFFTAAIPFESIAIFYYLRC